MTRTAEIEARVQVVAERTVAGHQNEDFLIELKSDWPKPEDGAWRIAGHANAAHGERILWVIGLDPNGNVTPAKHNELANWWQQVQKHFDDGIAPSLIRDVVVNLDTGPVVALLFDTEAAPFVLKGGADNHRVPFREGTRTNGVRRRQLVRLLAPTVKMPSVELLYARFSFVRQRGTRAGAVLYGGCFEARLYVAPHDGTVHFPAHRQGVRLRMARGELEGRPGLYVEDETAQNNAATSLSRPGWVRAQLRWDEGYVSSSLPDMPMVDGSLFLQVEGIDLSLAIPLRLSHAPAESPLERSIAVEEHGAWDTGPC